MAISPEGTFACVATLDAESLEPRERALLGQREVVFSARDKRGEDQPSLCGPNPRLVIIDDRLSIVATDRHNALIWKATCLAGDAALRHAQAGDVVYVSRSIMAGIGLSLIRGDELILALGAPVVPLGGVSLRQEPEITPALLFAPGIPDVWLRFTIGGESQNIRPRESAQLGPYHIYVECCGRGSPDDAGECIAISRGETSELRNAAMRSAILARSGGLKMTGWDFFS